MRRKALDDILGENIVEKPNRIMREEEKNNPPANNVNVEAIIDFVNSKTQQAETPQPTQPTQPIETQQIEKTTTPTDNSAFIEKATTKNVFAEKNKDVIAPKSTPAQQGFNTPEPKREEFNTYEKQINFLTPPETEEERLAREKKERSSKNLSALFDGLTALSNIYHTTQYAPPQTLSSGTEKMTQKYDKLRENADKIKKEYQNAILKLRQLDDADYQNAWNRWFALRKQYENGEISKQQMEQEWKALQMKLDDNAKNRQQKDKHHKEDIDLKKEEGAKNRAVQRENKKGKTLHYEDYSITIPNNTTFDKRVIYKAIRDDLKNGRILIEGANKNSFPAYEDMIKNDGWKSANGESREEYIDRIIELYAGESPGAREYFNSKGAIITETPYASKRGNKTKSVNGFSNSSKHQTGNKKSTGI